MKPQKILYIYLGIYFLFLLYQASTLSISPTEAQILYNQKSLLHHIVAMEVSLFGNSDIGFRSFFALVNIVNLLLFYDVAKKSLKKESDALFAALILSLLPGFISSSLVVSEAPLVIFLTLLFIYLYKKFRIWSALLFPLMLVVDNSFAVLFISLFFYALYKKERLLILLSLLFFALSMNFYGFDFGGKPRNYFLDTFGIYSAIFSPLVFIYFFYVIYRILVKGPKDLIWFVSFVAFVFSLILSFRQKIAFEDFAPFTLIGVVLMVREFLSSYRVRIVEHRARHKKLFIAVIVSLLINDAILVFNKPLYLVLENPGRHFAYNYHLAKELANILKKMGIKEVYTDDPDLQLQLRFYGIGESLRYKITENKPFRDSVKVSIRYKNIELKRYYVSKLNNK